MEYLISDFPQLFFYYLPIYFYRNFLLFLLSDFALLSLFAPSLPHQDVAPVGDGHVILISWIPRPAGVQQRDNTLY